MTKDELYKLAFEKVFEDKGYDKPGQIISEIFDLISEEASDEEEWSELANFALEVTSKILDWIQS